MNTGAAAGWTCTRVGSVKYPRRRKPFRPRDVIRVVRKVSWERSPVAWYAAVVELMINSPVTVPQECWDWASREFQARGGEFGGGGTTRGF